MRVTERLIFDRSSRDVGRARESSQSAQELVATGRKVNHPGDDPALAGQIAAFQVSSSRTSALSTTADLASRELQAADGALDTVGNVLSRARELAVQFSSDAYPADQRAIGAAEVETLVSSAIAALNMRYGNRWIFGGNEDGAPPFDPSGAYNGDHAQRQVEVAPGVLQDSAVRADVTVGGYGGGVDVLQTMQDLRQALATNDVTGIRNTLDPLDQGITQVATGRAEAGVSMDALAAAAEAGKIASQDEQVQLSELAQADISEASIRLAQAQQALEASMAAAAQGFRLTLVDFLR